eukprot:8332956-Pyramimonas_sp.AAC.1
MSPERSNPGKLAEVPEQRVSYSVVPPSQPGCALFQQFDAVPGDIPKKVDPMLPRKVVITRNDDCLHTLGEVV